MVSISNLHSVLGNQKKKDPDAEDTLLAAWTGRDSDTTESAICVRWSPDGTFLAAGYGDGGVRLYDSANGALRGRCGMPRPPQGAGNLSLVADVKLPCMAMRFKPKDTTKVLLRTACADGTIEVFDVKNPRGASSKQSFVETDKDNPDKAHQTLAMDYSPDGDKFITGGVDRAVRVYDDSAKAPTRVLSGSRVTPGHTNRIVSVRYHPDKAGVVGSASLDGTVLFWDARVNASEPFSKITDVAACGDSIDFRGNYVLIGSWRPTQQLQIYDFRKPTEAINQLPWKRIRPAAARKGWTAVRDAVRGSTCLYGAQFAPSKSFKEGTIVSGGSGAKEVKVHVPSGAIEAPSDSELYLGAYQPVASMSVPSGVQGLHVSNSGNIAVASKAGHVYNVTMPSAGR